MSKASHVHGALVDSDVVWVLVVGLNFVLPATGLGFIP